MPGAGEKLRIALTVDPEIAVPPLLYGGIERIADTLARNLALAGHEITLFANEQSTCTVPLVAWHGTSSRSRWDTLRNTVLLGKHVAAGKFDIIHSFSRLAYMTSFLPLPVPKLMTYHREITESTTTWAYYLSFGSLSFSAVGQHMIADGTRPGCWTAVSNCIPLATYDFQIETGANAPLVFLGRLEPIKGPDLAIKAARAAGINLVLAGNVPDEHRGWFEAKIKPHIDGERVRYIGPVDDIQKNALLGQARAFLMPIRWEEPFGMVMIEAMACGTPVIGFRRGAVPEIVVDGVSGFVVDTLDEMVAAIARISEIPRAACRQRVEQNYSERAVTDTYIALYRKLIARQGRAKRQPDRT